MTRREMRNREVRQRRRTMNEEHARREEQKRTRKQEVGNWNENGKIERCVMSRLFDTRTNANLGSTLVNAHHARTHRGNDRAREGRLRATDGENERGRRGVDDDDDTWIHGEGNGEWVCM